MKLNPGNVDPTELLVKPPMPAQPPPTTHKNDLTDSTPPGGQPLVDSLGNRPTVVSTPTGRSCPVPTWRPARPPRRCFWLMLAPQLHASGSAAEGANGRASLGTAPQSVLPNLSPLLYERGRLAYKTHVALRSAPTTTTCPAASHNNAHSRIVGPAASRGAFKVRYRSFLHL